MSWLKDLLSNWKVSVALIGGTLIVASVWGTCSYELPVLTTPAPDETQEDENTLEVEPASNESTSVEETAETENGQPNTGENSTTETD